MPDRSKRMTGEVVCFGPYCLSASERWLTKDGSPIAISGRALEVLIALTERAGEIVSTQELLDRVWPHVVVEEANIRVHISALRRALGKDSNGSSYVLNVSGRGYSIVTPVRRSIGVNVAPERQSNLPRALRSMIGRTETVAELSNLLFSKRFVSVVGPGGIGKTTAAIAVAHTVRPNFGEHAAFFVDLSSIEDKADVASAVAAAIGCSVPGVDPEPFILAFLANKKALIVLDGCEHVIDIAAPLAGRLVGAAPSLHLLATSREALRVQDEVVHLLSPLDGPANETPSAVEALASPAVQLFMRRAASAGYLNELGDHDAPIVADICRRLDGIALAIELAASRVGAYGIPGTADLLADNTRLRLQGRRSATTRHQTLQAMLDWSFDLLSQDERKILCRLSIFVGGFTWQAAQAVAGSTEPGPENLATAIDSLASKSLIAVSSTGGAAYYRLLDTTRIYAATVLKDSGEEQAMAERHASYFADFLKKDVTGSSNFDGRDAANYGLHLGNIRKALAWSFSDVGNRSTALELVTHAAPLFLGLSQFGECQRWCHRALSKLAPSEQDTELELKLVYLLARSAVYTPCDIHEVRSIFERAISLSERFQDTRRQLTLLADYNVVLTRCGDFKGALAAAKKSAFLADRTGSPFEMVPAEWMLGAAYHAAGDHAAALRHCTLGFSLASRAPLSQFDLLSEARARFVLSRSLWLQGFPDQALEAAHQTIDQMKKYSHHVSYCFALVYTIPVFLWRGDLDAAGNLVEIAITQATKYSLATFQTIARAQKGELMLAKGDVTAGLELLQDSHGEMLVSPYHIMASPTSCVLAKALQSVGRPDEAQSVLQEAVTRANRVDEQCWRPDLLRTQGEILLSPIESMRVAAEEFLLSSIDTARRQSALGWELKAAIPLARLWCENARTVSACSLLESIYERFTEGFATRDLTVARQLLEEYREPRLQR